MLRNTFALLILVLATSTLGCAICAAPDDYNGPTPSDGLGFNDRAGSILSNAVPPNAVFDQEVSQEALGPSVTEGPAVETIPSQPTPAVDYVPQSRRAAPETQWR